MYIRFHRKLQFIQVFKRAPFFHGGYIEDQLDKIAFVLGTHDLECFTKDFMIELDPKFNVVYRDNLRDASHSRTRSLTLNLLIQIIQQWLTKMRSIFLNIC